MGQYISGNAHNRPSQRVSLRPRVAGSPGSRAMARAFQTQVVVYACDAWPRHQDFVANPMTFGRDAMTTTIDRPICPSVFAAGLPEIDYEHCQSPDEAHQIISEARRQAPVAIGPHGPELLTYELVRSVLRDPRFRVPQGMFLASQGITSGPLWDRVATNLISLDGAAHHRLRRLVSKAFTPRATARLRTTIVDVITQLVDRHTGTGHCEVVTDIARQYPIPIICALLGAPSEDWELFSDWTDDIFKVFAWNVAAHERVILAA